MDRGGGNSRNSNLPNQYLYQSHSQRKSGTLGSRSEHSVGPWQKTTPALLKTMDDFGTSFIERQRRNRLNSDVGRARSEVAEILSNGGSNRMNSSFIHRRETSFDDNRHGVQRASSVYERPRSSFQPSNLPIPPSTNQRVMRQRDDWMEVARKNQFSSEDDYDDEDGFSEGDEELAMYNSSGRNNYPDFDDDDIYYLGVVQLNIHQARSIVSRNPPPIQFWSLKAEEKTAYLYYFTLYKKYIVPIRKFYNIFNREFFKYTSEGFTETEALVKICQHTKREYDHQRKRFNKQAYDRSRQQLFSDDRATPDSRISVYENTNDESDLASIDSNAKEPRKFNKPHSFITFGVGGKICIMNPEYSISTIKLEDVKNKIKNYQIKRNIEALEVFKGPLLNDETPTHAPLLFIETQIKKILKSEIYRQNCNSSDANDCLLIWRLLEILIRQHGNVTGPDLARLLTTDYSYTTSIINPIRGNSDKEIDIDYIYKDEKRIDNRSIERFTQFLLGGYIDEAIESAMNDGLLFDALMLAHRMYGNNDKYKNKLDEIETKLLAFRNPQQPALTLLSVASQMPVPILNNMTSVDDASGWRAHIAIVLANLNTEAAMKTVYELGLALSKKEFNAAADFCFLAVNLLSDMYNCFEPKEDKDSENEESYRKYITLINASLPDDEYYSTLTPYGWSITDFQATEIFDFALQMSQKSNKQNCLKNSLEYQKCRLQYAKLLAEYGGFSTSAYKYCKSIIQSIWDKAYTIDSMFLYELCNLTESLSRSSNQNDDDIAWLGTLKNVFKETINNYYQQQEENKNDNNEFNFTDDKVITSTPMNTFVEEKEVIENEHINDYTSTIIGNNIEQEKNQQQQHYHQQQQHYENQNYQQQEQQQNEQNKYMFKLSENNSPLTLPTSTMITQQNLPPTTPFSQIQDQQMILPQTPTTTLESNSNYDYNNIYKSSEIKSTQQIIPETIREEPESPKSPNKKFAYENNLFNPPEFTSTGLPPLFNQQQNHHQQQQQQTQLLNQQQLNFNQQTSEQHKDTETKPNRISTEPQLHKENDLFNPVEVNNQDKNLHNHQEQQQHSPKTLSSQHQSAPNLSEVSKDNKKDKKAGGFFGGLINKIIPASNEMKLPDDSNPTIKWDPTLNKYVGEGVEEQEAPPPPPIMPMPQVPNQNQFDQNTIQQTTSNTNVAPAPASLARSGSRRTAGSRYANPFAGTQAAASTTTPTAPDNIGLMPPPTNYASTPFFMPPPPPTDDNDDASVNPFSDVPQQVENQ